MSASLVLVGEKEQAHVSQPDWLALAGPGIGLLGSFHGQGGPTAHQQSQL